MLEEFNIENNSVSALPDGLLAAVENLTFITISRNQVPILPNTIFPILHKFARLFYKYVSLPL
jgi:Leucine-rich repeat (LRR) protein